MNEDAVKWLAQADAARDRGDHRRSAEIAGQAAQWAEQHEDHALAAQALARQALSEVRLGDLVAATAHGHRAVAHCAGRPADAGLSRIHSTLSLAYERAGLHRFAVAHAVKARDIARDCRDPIAECWALVRLGTADEGPDGAGHGLQTLAQAVAQARELGEPVLLFAALNNTTRRWVVESDHAVRRGEDPAPSLHNALTLANEATQLPGLSASAFVAATSMANLAGVYRRLGQALPSRAHSRSALEIAQHHNYEGLVATLRLEAALLDHQQQPSAQSRQALQRLLDAEPLGGGADPDLLLEARRALVLSYRNSDDLSAAIAQMERLNDALIAAQARRVELQSQLLFNQSVLDDARHHAELAKRDAELQRVRAEAEHAAANQLAQANARLEQEVAARTAELAAAKAAAEAASRAKSSFLSTLSHELHTPINGLVGMVGLAMRRATDPRQTDQLQKAADSAWRLNALFDNILDFVAADADAPAVASPTDLRQLLAAVSHKRAAAAQLKGIDVEIVVPEAVPATLRVDGGRLGRILDALLDNAIKFSTRGPVQLAVQCAADSGPDADAGSTTRGAMRLRIEVNDHGDGLAPETVQRLFRPFEMGDASSTRAHGGLGLGLALAQRLAGSLGGQVGLDPAPAVDRPGSRFWVSVPVQRV